MLTKDPNLRISAREIDEVLNNSFNLENMFEEMKVQTSSEAEEEKKKEIRKTYF